MSYLANRQRIAKIGASSSSEMWVLDTPHPVSTSYRYNCMEVRLVDPSVPKEMIIGISGSIGEDTWFTKIID